ncbi:MAG TPA: cytosine permease [Steroidobacteraceae bacterium]|nr:cytosine permease [Steroidobacteraceae bacterium]
MTRAAAAPDAAPDAAPAATPLAVAVADESSWPLLPPERSWGAARLSLTLVTTTAATWCYLIGESVGGYLGFIRGGLALTAGCLVGMLLVLLAAGPACIRFGIDSIASSKPQFGSRGWVVPGALQAVSIIGWNSLLIIFFAKSAVQLALALGLLGAGAHSTLLVPLLTLTACAIIFLALRRGARGVSMVSNILFVHVFVGLWMLYLLVSRRWPELMSAVPALAAPKPLWNYTTGFELGIVSTLSWWPYIGAMIRMAPDARTVVLPVLLGMGAPVPLLSLIGLAGVLVLKTSDPAQWLRTVGGPAYAIVSLAFVTAANFGTTIAGVYASAVGLRNFRALERRSWSALLLITLTPVAAVGVLIPELFFAKFSSFLALIGVAFAPLCGIQIADYFFLRRRRIDIRALYASGARQPYYYWMGINWAALLALTAGCLVYVTLLNPITYASSAAYPYLTASLPAALTAALSYGLASRVVMRAGRGGYRPAEETPP